jgi:hypothetical protein
MTEDAFTRLALQNCRNLPLEWYSWVIPIRSPHREGPPEVDASDDFVTLSQARSLQCSQNTPSRSPEAHAAHDSVFVSSPSVDVERVPTSYNQALVRAIRAAFSAIARSRLADGLGKRPREGS